MFDKIDYKTVSLAGREVRLTINHSERSISARLNDGYPAEFRLTGYLSKHLALGASVRLEYGGEEDMHAGLYLGPLRIYAAINNRLLGSIIRTVKLGRRMTSLEVSLGNRYGDPSEGTAMKVRAHLWDDDNHSGPKSRAFSFDLLDGVLGKPVSSEKRIVEERDVVVPLPEGSFTTKARLVERFVQRPGWPFKRFHRWVEFRETPAAVPQKGGGTSFYNMGGPWTGVTGVSIGDGIAEFVRRVLEQRSRYGGKAWETGVPAVEKSRDSHEVSVWQVINGKEHEVWRGDIAHGDVQSFAPTLCDLQLRRHEQHGGVVLTSPSRYVDVVRGVLIHGDEIITARAHFKFYSSPIGPAPAPTQQGNVNAFDILAAAKAAGLHGVNGGPAIGRVGRSPLQGLKAAHVLLAEEMDPQWFAANTELVAGARAVHPASTFDVETHRWNEPSAANQEVILLSAQEAFERAQQWATSLSEKADVQEVLAELDTTPPGPTEEADGLAARERILDDPELDIVRTEFSAITGVDLAVGKDDQTVAQLFEVQGNNLHRVGEPWVIAPLPSIFWPAVGLMTTDPAATHVSAMAPADTRTWLPTGPLTVTIARGETKTIVQLPHATSYRVGAHKDAEIRLLGAHALGAVVEQDNGGIWVCRRSDNVAVDLLGLNLGERVQLREGAEVQIGQLYTLTFTSRGA